MAAGRSAASASASAPASGSSLITKTRVNNIFLGENWISTGFSFRLKVVGRCNGGGGAGVVCERGVQEATSQKETFAGANQITHRKRNWSHTHTRNMGQLSCRWTITCRTQRVSPRITRGAGGGVDEEPYQVYETWRILCCTGKTWFVERKRGITRLRGAHHSKHLTRTI